MRGPGCHHDTRTVRPLGYEDGFTAADVRKHLDGKVPRQAMPKDVEFVDEIPLSDIGKIDKKELEDRHEAAT